VLIVSVAGLGCLAMPFVDTTQLTSRHSLFGLASTGLG
jgi:hypothetical protein